MLSYTFLLMLLCYSLRSAFYVCLSMSSIWKKASSSFLRCVHFSDFWHIWSDVHSLCEYSTTFQKRSAVNCANYSYFDMNDFKMPSFMVYCYEKKQGTPLLYAGCSPFFSITATSSPQKFPQHIVRQIFWCGIRRNSTDIRKSVLFGNL